MSKIFDSFKRKNFTFLTMSPFVDIHAVFARANVILMSMYGDAPVETRMTLDVFASYDANTYRRVMDQAYFDVLHDSRRRVANDWTPNVLTVFMDDYKDLVLGLFPAVGKPPQRSAVPRLGEVKRRSWFVRDWCGGESAPAVSDTSLFLNF